MSNAFLLESLFVFFSILFFSCQQAKEQKTAKKSDSVLIKEFREQQKKWAEEDRLLTLEKEKKIQKEKNEQYNINNIHQDSALQNALVIAKTTLHLNNFEKKYDLNFDSTSNIHIEIAINYFFNGKQKCLLIRREVFSAIYFDIYKIVNNIKVEHWFRTEYSHFNSPKVIFFDANGDNVKDFVVHWTPQSGCCRRNIYDVYLYLYHTNTFSEKYDFINPTFYPKEKIIRGVGYGHPSEVGLYKYKWNGLKIDTMEFIYPLLSHKNEELNIEFIKTKKTVYKPNTKDGILLKEVPKEYLSVTDYEWFEMFKK